MPTSVKKPSEKRKQTKKDDDVYQRLADAIMRPRSTKQQVPNPEQLERTRKYVKKNLLLLAVEIDLDTLPTQAHFNSATRLLNTYVNAHDILVRMIRDECVTYVQNIARGK